MPEPRANRANTLLVEGVNDREFIYQLTNRAGIARGAYKVHDWKEGEGGFQLLVDSFTSIFRGQ